MAVRSEHHSHTSPISKTVFVTGASGAVGRTIAITFRRHGYTVYGLVRSKERADKALLVQEEIIPVIGDSGDPKTYCDVIAKAGILVEASTLTSSPDYINNVINEAKKGRMENGDLKSVVWITGFLQYPFEPEVFKSEGVNVTSVRPSFLYGPNGGPAWREIFFKPLPVGKVQIHGKKDKRWPWCHVIDFGEALPLIIQNIDKVKGRSVAVGSGENLPTYEELAIASARAQGYQGEFEYVPAPDASFYQAVDLDIPNFDNSFITSLGWKPRFDNKNIISNIPILLESYKAFN